MVSINSWNYFFQAVLKIALPVWGGIDFSFFFFFFPNTCFVARFWIGLMSTQWLFIVRLLCTRPHILVRVPVILTFSPHLCLENFFKSSSLCGSDSPSVPSFSGRTLLHPGSSSFPNCLELSGFNFETFHIVLSSLMKKMTPLPPKNTSSQTFQIAFLQTLD